jgi:hypothetical protein
MTRIVNPEKECPVTPEKFSAESKIVCIDLEDISSGIVFDSPEEVRDAIVIYGDGSVPGSGSSQRKDLEAIGEDHGAMAAGICLLGGAIMNRGSKFSETVATRAMADLKKEGRFYESFEYTFNNFQKTSLSGKKIGDKYVLNISAAYVGSGPEISLAQTLKKPLAVVSSKALGKLSLVDDWWFNYDLKQVADILPSDIEVEAESWANYLVDSLNGGKKPSFPIRFKDGLFTLTLGTDASRHLRPEGGDWKSAYLQARKDSIVGGAWTSWNDEGKQLENPITKQPHIIYSVSLLDKKTNYERPAVTPEEMASVRGARDHFARLLEMQLK